MSADFAHTLGDGMEEYRTDPAPADDVDWSNADAYWLGPLDARQREYLARRDAAQRAEGAALGRRATLDPGAFVKRGPDYGGNAYGERLDHWQARAIAAALARTEPTHD